MKITKIFKIKISQLFVFKKKKRITTTVFTSQIKNISMPCSTIQPSNDMYATRSILLSDDLKDNFYQAFEKMLVTKIIFFFVKHAMIIILNRLRTLAIFTFSFPSFLFDFLCMTLSKTKRHWLFGMLTIFKNVIYAELNHRSYSGLIKLKNYFKNTHLRNYIQITL